MCTEAEMNAQHRDDAHITVTRVTLCCLILLSPPTLRGYDVRVHLFIWSITQKTNDPKVFKLGTGNDLGYPRNDMDLEFQGHRLGLRLRQQQYSVSSNSMSAFYTCAL